MVHWRENTVLVTWSFQRWSDRRFVPTLTSSPQ